MLSTELQNAIPVDWTAPGIIMAFVDAGGKLLGSIDTDGRWRLPHLESDEFKVGGTQLSVGAVAALDHSDALLGLRVPVKDSNDKLLAAILDDGTFYTPHQRSDSVDVDGAKIEHLSGDESLMYFTDVNGRVLIRINGSGQVLIPHLEADEYVKKSPDVSGEAEREDAIQRADLSNQLLASNGKPGRTISDYLIDNVLEDSNFQGAWDPVAGQLYTYQTVGGIRRLEESAGAVPIPDTANKGYWYRMLKASPLDNSTY